MSDQVLTNPRDDPAPQRARVRDRSASALVAPATFKGTFSAAEVAAAIARGVREGGFEAEELPIADGGDDTLDVLVSAGPSRRASACCPAAVPWSRWRARAA